VRGLPLGLAFVLLLGLGLRTAQYLGEVDLWHDEIALARSVEDRGLVDLVSRPLDYQQVAPVGFMAMIDVA
jgi:hypothetical protein